MEIVEKRHFQYKPNFFKIMEDVSSKDFFSINPFFRELFRKFQLCMEIVESVS